MKSVKAWLGLAVAGWLAVGTAWAGKTPKAVDTVSGGVTWSYAVVGGTASVMGAKPTVGVLTIPEVLDGYPVTGVGYKAFGSCDGLTEVVIPAGVTSIWDRAFQYCAALEKVSIPAGVTNIGAWTFQYCKSLETVTLPQGLADIGTNAFYRCDALQKLYVPVSWEGTSKVSAAGVGAGCTVVYGEPEIETVIFDANGGSCETAMRSYPLGVAYGWLPEAKAKDQRFAGWWTEASGGSQITEADGASVEGVRRLYAHWTLLAQTVTFEANGGNCGTTTAVFTVGGTYSPLPAATREHFDFSGWFTEWGSPITESTEVTTDSEVWLYAHWTRLDQEITFDANGGSCGTTTAVYPYGGTYSPLPTPTREHYAFAGWWTGPNWGEHVTESSEVTTDSDRWLYAHWTLVEQVVTFDANGGECNTVSGVYAVGGTYKPLPEATREHYDFDGWFSEADGGDRLSGASTVTTNATRTLYAHWTAAEQVVTFVNNYGATGETLTYAYPIGEPYGWLPEPTREGGVFDGWRTETGEEVDPASVVAPNETLTLYAGWWGYSVSGSGAIVKFFGTPRKHLVVPADLGGLPVTGIAGNAFRDCSCVVSVEIPEGVTSIGKDAFSGCSKLTAVHIHNLAAWCGISFGSAAANPLYYAHHLYLEGEELVGDFVIPDSVTNIRQYAFYNCNGLTSVTIPDSLSSIGQYAFSGCSGLTSVHIHDLVAWNRIAFSDNPLTYAHHLYLDGAELVGNLIIPDNVTHIGQLAFSGCSGLTSVTIPDSVTSIGDSAFSGCTSLTRVTIPDSVTSIGDSAFSGCTSLTRVTISNSVTCIAFSAFSGCNSLTCMTIPDSVTSIGNSAFSGCSGLTSVAIPDSVTSIGDSAFSGCSSLTRVTIPDSVTNIGSSAFSYCRGLMSVTISDSVTSIGSSVFSGCSGLSSVMIPNSVRSIGSGAFYGCSSLTSLTIPNSVTNIGRNVFSGCGGLKTLYVPTWWYNLECYVPQSEIAYDVYFWKEYSSVPSGCGVVYGLPTSQETRFDANGGRCAVVSQMHAVGEAYGELPEAVREGYAFGGWWTDRVGGKHVTGESGVSAISMLWLYAHWSLADDEYAAWLAERGETEASLPVEGDADGDGMTNWEEYVAGTDPRNGQARLEARVRWEGGKPKVETSVAVPGGRKVRVEGRKSLAGDEGWTDVTGKEASWEREGWRFFRVGVEVDGAQ